MMCKKQGGFTIVEMSVVVFIIGLIIVGITAGKNLLDGGKTRAVVSEMDEYRQSMIQFQEKYLDWPGDITNASTLWSGENNGDGDERIEWATEGTLVWRHLEMAAMIGQTGFAAAASADAVVGSNVPSSKIPGAGWFVDYDSTLHNHLGLGLQKAAGMNDDPALPPKRAGDIDAKVDDGFPSSGQAQSTGADCLSGTAYQVEETTPSCTIRFSIAN